jgi:hypothetical protein
MRASLRSIRARVAAAIGRDAGPDAATCIRGYLNRIEVI